MAMTIKGQSIKRSHNTQGDDSSFAGFVKPRRRAWSVSGVFIGCLLAAAALGLAVYDHLTLPSQVQSYVQTHKAQLRGPQGEPGAQGLNGRNGVSGANGYNSYSPTHCSTYTYSTLNTADTYCN